MKWSSRVRDALYLNFAVNEEEVDRILPPGVTVDSRLYRGEPWGLFSLIVFRHDPIRMKALPWPRGRFPQATLRIYIKNTDGRPSVYFKRLYMPSWPSLFARWYGKQPVTTMDFDVPGRVHEGGSYRWRLSGNGEGNIAGKVGRRSEVNGSLVGLFDSRDEFVDFIRERPEAYYGAGRDSVYCLRAEANYGEYRSFQVKEWELGFLAEDLERHNFPEAMSASFLCPEMSFTFRAPDKVDLGELTTI